MKKYVIFMLALGAVACGSDDKGKAKVKDGNVQTTAIGGTCAQEDATGCDGNTLVSCVGGLWKYTLNCENSGKVCGERSDRANEFACKTAPVDPSNNACTVNGHNSVATFAFYDNDIMGYFTIDSYDVNTSTGALIGAVRLLTMPNAALNTAISLSGNNSNIQTCQTCIYAFDASNKIYMADEGSVTFTQLDTGDNGMVMATVTGLHMREVESTDSGFSDVPNGGTWCVPTVTYNAAVTRYPCYYMDPNPDDQVDFAPGQSACGSGNTENMIINCEPSALADQGTDPGQLVVGDDCNAASQICSQSTATSAVCQ